MYEENGFTTLAWVDSLGSAAQVYWYHAELNGLPERMTDAEGETVWRGTFSAWGRTLAESGSGRWRGQQNLRFQGQYLDRETGLHYNTLRYYDAWGGCYTQVDPIGLLGGLNTYGYVGDPLTWVDPLGLAPCRTKPRLEAGNLKEGWEHIRSRHIDGDHPSGAGDLFSPRTTRADIEKYAELLVNKGTRQSDPSRTIQMFEKRLNINGLRANYRLIVDSSDGNRIITMFPTLGGGH